MNKRNPLKRREPLTDTMLLVTISVGGVIALVVMTCVMHLNNGGSIFSAALLAIGIGLAFGLTQGFLIMLQSVVLSLRGKGGIKRMVPKWLTSSTKE